MLGIRLDEVEALLVMLILDGRVDGALDGVHHVLQINLSSPSPPFPSLPPSFHQWSEQVHAVALAISHKQGKQMSKWASDAVVAKRLVRTK